MTRNVVPVTLFYDKRISPGAFKLYTFLWSFGEKILFVHWAATKLKVTRGTIYRWVNELKDSGYISVDENRIITYLKEGN